MNKERGLELIGKLSKASIRTWELCNTRARGSIDKAANDELKAAKAILHWAGTTATDEEISEALR